MLLLVDTRDRRPPPGPERPPWEPNWPMWAWIAAALATAVAAAGTGGFVAYLLVCATIACACRAVSVALPYGQGLREHRQ
jgi:hypothetical protein